MSLSTPILAFAHSTLLKKEGPGRSFPIEARCEVQEETGKEHERNGFSTQLYFFKYFEINNLKDILPYVSTIQERGFFYYSILN